MPLTQWPTTLPVPVLLGVVGRSPLDGLLRQLTGRPLADRNTLAVVNVGPDDALAGCHAVFIDDSPRRHVKGVLARLHGQPVPATTDGDWLADRGVMIEIGRRNERPGVEVNLQPSTLSRLPFSARMLTLTKHVSWLQSGASPAP